MRAIGGTCLGVKRHRYAVVEACAAVLHGKLKYLSDFVLGMAVEMQPDEARALPRALIGSLLKRVDNLLVEIRRTMGP